MNLEQAIAALAAEHARSDALQRKVDHLTRLLEKLMVHLGVTAGTVGTVGTDDPATDATTPPEGSKEQPSSPPAANKEKKKRREGHGRSELPDHLPRDERHHRPSACPKCGGTELRDIGTETTELLDYVPSYVRVRKVVRHTCACSACNTLVTAPAPANPIDKGRATAAFLAWILYGKYATHMPLERTKGELKRLGVVLQVSTMCGWVRQSAFLLQPLVRRMAELLFEDGVVQTDGTGLQVLRRGQDKAHIGQIAVYCGPRLAIYQYTPTKEGKHAAAFLDRFKGVLVADAASTFDQLYTTGKIVEAGCWAHARRKFEDIVDHDPAAAHEAIAWIASMYEVESDARERQIVDQALGALRKERTAPIVADFKVWLDDRATTLLPKSSTGKAVAYCRRHWTALTRFLDDPRLPLDNNLSERCLRTVAVGRKNYIFAGSDEGAASAAVLYSIIQTCKLNDRDPLAYLTDILDRLAVHPDNRIRGGTALDDLLPHRWQQPTQ